MSQTATVMAALRRSVSSLVLPILAWGAGLYLIYRNVAASDWFEAAFAAFLVLLLLWEVRKRWSRGV